MKDSVDQPKQTPPSPPAPPAKPTKPAEVSQSAHVMATKLGKSSGKRQWLMWFGVFCILAIPLFWTVSPLKMIISGGIIVVVIFLLFVGTMWKSWRDICFLDQETRLASQQVLQLQQVGDINRFIKEAAESLFRSHISSLHTIFKSDSHISQESLVEVLHARLVARNKVVEMFASVLITLGLIGTIIGLIGSIGGLDKLLNNDGSEMNALRSAIGETVSGLDTAFYTTLIGAVFGGVVLRILNGVVDANILNYTAHLAELTDVYVLPPMRKMARQLSESGYYSRQAKVTP